MHNSGTVVLGEFYVSFLQRSSFFFWWVWAIIHMDAFVETRFSTTCRRIIIIPCQKTPQLPIYQLILLNHNLLSRKLAYRISSQSFFVGYLLGSSPDERSDQPHYSLSRK